MKRILGLGCVAMLASLLGGCVAVSAKGVPLSRFAAVASANGKIYVVDIKTKTAEPVRILTEGEEVK